MYSRGHRSAPPGNGPWKSQVMTLPPMNGIARPTQYPIASPMPDIKSSTSE